VTRHYYQLQGLRLVPLAVVFSPPRSGAPLSYGRRTEGQFEERRALLLGAIGWRCSCSLPIDSWYTWRFGIAEQSLLNSGAIPLWR